MLFWLVIFYFQLFFFTPFLSSNAYFVIQYWLLLCWIVFLNAIYSLSNLHYTICLQEWVNWNIFYQKKIFFGFIHFRWWVANMTRRWKIENVDNRQAGFSERRSTDCRPVHQMWESMRTMEPGRKRTIQLADQDFSVPGPVDWLKNSVCRSKRQILWNPKKVRATALLFTQFWK